MAFYAEMVRRGSWLVNHVNMIYYYQGVLAAERRRERQRKHEEYLEWYNSLSDEERMAVDRQVREREEKDQRELMQSMMRLMSIPLILANSMSRGSCYGNKYGGVYNNDGTVNEDYFRNKKEEDIIDVEAVEV